MGRIFARAGKLPVLASSAMGLAAIFAIVLFLFLPYVPRGALGLAYRFVGDLREGRIGEAYELTDKGADVGKDVRAFAGNEDVVFLSSSRHPVTLEWAKPERSRARRILEFLRGTRSEPAVLYVNFDVGLPFLVRLRRARGLWVVSYFEVHAE
jgi:hypothetical protein